MPNASSAHIYPTTKHQVPFTIILLASSCLGQDKPKLIGEIEFFGYSGIDLNKVRAALPFHEKDRFNAETFAEKEEEYSQSV